MTNDTDDNFEQSCIILFPGSSMIHASTPNNVKIAADGLTQENPIITRRDTKTDYICGKPPLYTTTKITLP